ncbi:MAG: hypothetical protein E7480_06265 [Ruminococcaceae bacterium]|nr:hypothetical protein [Oscillospiraceae bacterium]
MTLRENILAILNYQPYERMPVVSFGYWNETVLKWAKEGHITEEMAQSYINDGDNGKGDNEIMKLLGFDFNWNSCVGANNFFDPFFEPEVLERFDDGSEIVRDNLGLIIKHNPNIVSIPAELGTSLKDRETWEKLYKHRLQMNDKRVDKELFKSLPSPEEREIPLGLHLGSLIGNMRNILGVAELSYLLVDDEDLFKEIVDTICGLSYECAKEILETGVKFDYAHFWEDICFKNGPLVAPYTFEEFIVPHYKKITDLVRSYGIDIISVDCDGLIDSLVPLWLDGRVNTMFPIEVGTWNASVAPWREKYGKQLRGVGGMNKTVFAKDKEAVDKEVKRLKELIKLGGYIPCPDHRIAPDAEFELVKYYCEQMRKI